MRSIDSEKEELQVAIRNAKRFYFEKQYDSSTLACSIAVAILLKRLYLRILSEVPTGEQRFSLVKKEMELGHGKGVERFTLGSLAHFCKETDLLNLAEAVLDVELGESKSLNFEPMIVARNQTAHLGGSISQETSGMVLFQTMTLLECLRIVALDAQEEDKVVFEKSLAANDELEYIRQRLARLEATFEPHGTKIPIQCQAAFTYAKINPEDALFKLRKILEYIVRHLYSRIAPPKAVTLDELITRLSAKNRLPNRIFKHMEIVKGFGNRGAHPGDEEYRLNDVETVFLSLLTIIDWYFEECKKTAAEQPPGPDISR